MKELSIEEKAKRYNKIFAKAKIEKEKSRNLGLLEFIENNFPELAESDDERIRKAIINVFASHKDYEVFFGASVEDIFAWLEKQGEKSVDKLQVSGELYEHIRNTCACIDDALSSDTLADINDYLSMAKHSANSAFDMIEKQGEQKSVIEGTFVNVDEVREGFMQEVYRALYDDPTNDRANQIIDAFDHLPTIIIQNTADNVEQKFHEGEWVIFNENHNSVYQVERIDNYRYYLRHYLGGTLSVHFDNELIRKWTIEDAKAGDVLAVEDMVFIYKRILSSYVVSYCSLYHDNFDHFVYARTCHEDNSNLRPATKEQRELLFQKMKEAGYEWDAENKKLKKIERKPAWNEEDESMYVRTLGVLGKCYIGELPIEVEEELKWLKSIKDRVLPQPKQEWSEEDENIKESIITGLEMLKDGASDKSLIALYNKKIEWLKSIRPQSQWKPSEEQMEALYEETQKSNRIKDDRIVSLYNDLKKLMEE